jgi:type I restriction enzyme M protein
MRQIGADTSNVFCNCRENRDNVHLDLFWLRDQRLEESDNLPYPDVLAQDIVEDLEGAREPFREIANDLGTKQEQ